MRSVVSKYQLQTQHLHSSSFRAREDYQHTQVLIRQKRKLKRVKRIKETPFSARSLPLHSLKASRHIFIQRKNTASDRHKSNPRTQRGAIDAATYGPVAPLTIGIAVRNQKDVEVVCHIAVLTPSEPGATRYDATHARSFTTSMIEMHGKTEMELT